MVDDDAPPRKWFRRQRSLARSFLAVVVATTTTTTTMIGSFRSATAFSCRPSSFRSTVKTKTKTPFLSFATNDDDDDSNNNENGLDWLRKAMGTDAMSTTASETVPRENGLVGFAVDRSLGFVAVVGSVVVDVDDDEGNNDVRYACAVVSRKDRSSLSSPEALTLVQLAGGLDLGTAVLPPDALDRVCRYNDEDDDNDDDDDQQQQRRGKVELLSVTAVLRDDKDDESTDAEYVRTPDDDDDDATATASTLAREAAVVAAAPRVCAAVRRLPGLDGVDERDVVESVRRRADVDGALDREAFSALLQDLREIVDGAGDDDDGGAAGIASFSLGVSTDGGTALRTVDDVDRFAGVALSLRYGVPIGTKGGFSSSNPFVFRDAASLVERFPNFRPLKELEEDAKVMDGFVPSMFFKEKPPGIDDRA